MVVVSVPAPVKSEESTMKIHDGSLGASWIAVFHRRRVDVASLKGYYRHLNRELIQLRREALTARGAPLR
jgi:hypothetical protein